VVATLRDYLSCEYIAKLGVEKTFSKDTIKGACPKVPQQSNFTDCGLYVLQYVESFFKASTTIRPILFLLIVHFVCSLCKLLIWRSILIMIFLLSLESD